MQPLPRLTIRLSRSTRALTSFTPIVVGSRVQKFTTSTFETDEMGKDKEKSNFQLKVPKGTKDWEGKDMVIRDKIFGTITDVFKRHGAVTIDT
jgi:hypothetical protein